MAGNALDLVPIWTVIIGASVFFYVLLTASISGSGYCMASRREHRKKC